MVDPIEEFLRRAAQHRQRKAPEEEIIDAEVLEDDEILEPEPLAETTRGILSGGGVAEHVEQHIGSASFDQRVAKLGAVVDAADDRMEAHLHDVFEHRLGQLGARTSAAAASTLDDDSGKPAEQARLDITQLFRTPDNIRNAILLHEILQRPEHRW